MHSRSYFVPPVALTAVSGVRQSGSISSSAPYYVIYGSGSKVLFIIGSLKVVAESGTSLQAPSYPYSCSTYAYDLTGTIPTPPFRAIDPPFRVYPSFEESSSPLAEVGTHYGRAAAVQHPTHFIAGFWSVHWLPQSVSVAYASTHKFPWEVGYTASVSLDLTSAVAVDYTTGSGVIVRSPIYYSTGAYTPGTPMNGAVQLLSNRTLTI